MAIDIEYALLEIAELVKRFKTPVVDLIAVQQKDPYKILVATILSSRTKDETTAKAASRLFKAAPAIDGLELLSEEKIARLIYPVGFYRTKAKHLKMLPGALSSKFQGKIPTERDHLVALPGVGRKTANLVASLAFKRDEICVDTHVHRIMNIWGYVKTKKNLDTEIALREKLPKKYWRKVNSLLVAFGQSVCRPVAPHCDSCILAQTCPKIGVIPRKKTGSKVNGKKMKKDGIKQFVSWNVNGLRAVEKKGFIDIVNELSPDIFAVQEIKATPDQLSEELKNIPGYVSYWGPAQRKGYSGVAVYAKREPIKVIKGLGVEEYDAEGRLLALEYDDFYFINTYFPNARHGLVRLDYKLQFNQAFMEFVNNLDNGKSVVICGDLNVAHKPIDLANPKSNEKNPGFSAPERAWMDSFVDAGFIDTFRKFNEEAGQYTWWSYRFNARARNIGWRIDYFCVDKKSESRVHASFINKDIIGSDHCPVSLEFK